MKEEPIASPEQDHAPDLWAIVLAGGEGARLAPVTRLLYGCEMPKQFAFLGGDRSLLQKTMDRIAPMVPPHRTVVVVARNRRQMAETQLSRYEGVQIVAQPANAGTGPGVLLPLAQIKAQQPQATVMVTPSDHYIATLAPFLSASRLAAATARCSPSGLVVLGAEAERPDPDLGWIVAEDSAVGSDPDVGLVDVFVEKPSLSVALDLFRRGGLWNTMVVFGEVESFWRQAGRYMPSQIALFNRYLAAITEGNGRSSAIAESLLANLYRSMPRADFSRSILQNVRGTAVVKLKGSGWCDCGTPARLLGCLGDSIGQGRNADLRAALHSMMPVTS